MILKGESAALRLYVPFHLPQTSNPLLGLTGHVFTLGEVQVVTPGGALTSVAVDHIHEIANGDYAAELTPAQATVAGKVFIYANVTGAQPWSSAEDIIDPAELGGFAGTIGPGTSTGAGGSRAQTLAQLRADVQRRGAYEGSRDITPVVLNDYINEAVAECYDILVEKWQDYYTTIAGFAFIVGTDTYALPVDFYKLRKIELQWDTTPRWARVMPHDLEVSHEYRQNSSRHYRYRIQGGALVFVPVPQVAETLRMFYVPTAPLLIADTDAFDGINGYEELVVQLAFMRCRQREDLDTGDIEREIARLTARVRTASDGRDATEPFTLDPHHSRSRGDGHWGELGIGRGWGW
jgi:hypothetical protein